MHPAVPSQRHSIADWRAASQGSLQCGISVPLMSVRDHFRALPRCNSNDGSLQLPDIGVAVGPGALLIERRPRL